MKRTIIIFLAILTSFVMLFGIFSCKKGKTEEAVELRWRTRPDNQAEIDVYQKISDDLATKLQGIKLKYEPGGSESGSYQDVLKTEIGAGTAPDVFWIPGTDVADFVKNGLIMDMRAYASKAGHKDSDFYPGPMYHLTMDPASGSTGSKLWGLPRDVSTFALYLNLDLIEEAGAPDPRELAKQGKWDWEAFEKVAKMVSALDPNIKGYGQSLWWGPFGYWINAAGGNMFNADRTKSAMNTPEALKGLEFMKKIYDAKICVPWGEDPEPPFLAGNVAMFQNGRWATPGARSSAKFNWDVVELPKGPSGKIHNWLFWGAYVVNAKTKNPEKCWELLNALTGADVQGSIAALGANIPSRVSKEALDKFLTFTPPQNNQAFINGLSDAQAPVAEGPLWKGNWPVYSDVLNSKITAYINGDITLDQFKNTVSGELDKTFD